MSDDDWSVIRGGVLFPEMIPGTFSPKANLENNYLIDRGEQRQSAYTGIKSIPVQDYAATQDVGGFQSPTGPKSV
ncbi:hypothetical protein [Paraburkholderia sp. ZP32-5]|uniref:hypothetical protein n=1 Tax=Paraburkholderia sp. ZP32-5 TaxID=2883245 RepID=UPI001F1F3836|nr:hypothetical protein [Paraburkholderia sp. ZP32-5]